MLAILSYAIMKQSVEYEFTPSEWLNLSSVYCTIYSSSAYTFASGHYTLKHGELVGLALARAGRATDGIDALLEERLSSSMSYPGADSKPTGARGRRRRTT